MKPSKEDQRHAHLTHLKLLHGVLPTHLEEELKEHQSGGSIMVPIFGHAAAHAHGQAGAGLFDDIVGFAKKAIGPVLAAVPHLLTGDLPGAAIAGATAALTGSGLSPVNRQKDVLKRLKALKV
jgi:hypothetical protein